MGRLSLRASGSNVHLSWTHPKAWRKLRSVTVRVLDAEREIGSSRSTRSRARLAADGDVNSAAHACPRRQDRERAAEAEGRPAFAHRKLAFAVEAIDVDGRRQVER